MKYNAAANVAFTLADGTSGTGSNGGDIYTGLDRFGQLIETIWKPSSGANLVQSSYGRNRFGGVVWRRDDAAHAMLKLTNDNDYWYDGLYQVQQHERGQLNAYLTGINSPVQSETKPTRAPRSTIQYPITVGQPNYAPAGNMHCHPEAR